MTELDTIYNKLASALTSEELLGLMNNSEQLAKIYWQKQVNDRCFSTYELKELDHLLVDIDTEDRDYIYYIDNDIYIVPLLFNSLTRAQSFTNTCSGGAA